MLGFSVFLGDTFHSEKIAYIEGMLNNGFTRIFTSLHIPEEDPTRITENLLYLGELTKKNQVELLADISIDGLQRLGIDLNQAEDVQRLRALGITGIRMDYGINHTTIAKVSHEMTVALNASTLTDADVFELQKANANFKQMELWHNYYPRPETGLSKHYLNELNKRWHQLDLKMIAFVPGDTHLRGPLYQGLPTLEKHRGKHPLFAAVDLFNNYGCDGVCIGDEGLKESTQRAFQIYFQEKKVRFHVEVLDAAHQELFIGTHTNRVDDAAFVLRSQEARFKQVPVILPSQTIPRLKGSITLDNQKYLRYMGELQITKCHLPEDDRVNVVARIVETERDLIDCVLPGYQFELVERRNLA